MNIEQRFEDLIAKATKAQEAPWSYGYLPGIVRSLEKMRKSLHLGREERSRMASGLFRLVSEDGAFLASKLGQELGQLADDFENLPGDQE